MPRRSATWPTGAYLPAGSFGRGSHVAAYVAKPGFQQPSGVTLAGAMLLSGVYRITAELVAQSPTYPGYFGSDAERYPERSSLDGLLSVSTPLRVGRAERDPAPFREQAEWLRAGLQKAGRRFWTAVSPPTATCPRCTRSTATTLPWATRCGPSSRRSRSPTERVMNQN